MAVDINVHYTDRNSDPRKQPFTLVPGEVNTNATSLVLSGQGAPNYSSSVNENFLHLLENFASANPPLHGTVGQLWYSTSGEKELRILSSIGTNGSGQRVDNWSPVGANIAVGTTPPTQLSRLWYDTSPALASNHQLKIYNTTAAAWQPVAKQWLAVGTTPPTNNSILWYNTAPTPRELYIFDTISGIWQPAVSHAAGLLTGNVPDSVLTISNIGGNAATATNAVNAQVATSAVKLQTGRTFSITGAATATGIAFDGQQNIALNVTALNASSLTTGIVPVARLGDAGPRAVGYYLAGNNVWTALPAIPDSYTKAEDNALLAQKAWRDGITYVGFAGDNPTLPYMRRVTDNGVYYLQPRLGYTPAPVSNTLAGYGIVDAYTKAEVNSLIPVMPPPTTGVLGSSGWTKLSNNMLMQWGQGPALGDDGSAVISLYIPAAILNIQVTGIGVATNGIGPGFMTDSWTTTSFRVSNNYNSGPWRPFSWLAITAV